MSASLTKAREERTVALDEFEKAVEAISNPAADADVAVLEARCAEAETELDRRTKIVNDLEKVAEARTATNVIAERTDVKVGREESVYRPDTGVSFFRDLVFSRVDADAAERLRRHDIETRNVTSVSNGFIPPVFLSELMAESLTPGRPFADVLPKAPLPQTGTSFTVPRMATGTTVAAQTEGGSVSNTDVTTDTVTVALRTAAGEQNISQQLLDRSEPAFDYLIARDLQRKMNAQIDTWCLSGTSAAKQFVGVGSVSGINSVTYTDASPTGAELLPKVYQAISAIASARYETPDLIVMHPRRAAWLASQLSTSFPLFQQGGFFQAVGSQDKGFVGTFAGLNVVADPNITTTAGAGTNEDKIYVLYSQDLVLMEGDARFRALEAPLASTLEVKLQLFKYAGLLSERYPSGIAVISGTGLASPTWA